MSSCNCCFLTSLQISQEVGQVVWYSHLLKNFPVCCDPHSQRLWCSKWSKSRCFLEFSCFFDDPTEFVNLIFGYSAFSKFSLNIWKFSVHILLKLGLGNFEHSFASVWDDCQLCGSLSILWHCLSLRLEWKLTFSSPVATTEFSKVAGMSEALSQHHLLGLEIAQLEFHHLH